MIKIAYILTPVEFGGSEKVNLTFLKNVDRERFDVHPVLLVRPWEKDNLFVNQIEEAEYSVCRIPVALKPRSEGRDYFRVARCILHLYRILSGKSFDLVHTHGYFADIIGTPACRLLRIPHVSTCHGFISNDRNLRIYNRLDRFSLRFSERIITVSAEIKNDLVRNGIEEARVVVIRNAVQNSYGEKEITDHRTEKRQLLSIGPDDFVIGYVGRLSEEKGVHDLVEAASILKEKFEAFKMIIIGDGQKREELEGLSRRKGLEKEIIFTGFQSDVEKWLPALDVFVLPSLTEGTPMALLEAMAVGVPAIATSVGGVPKVIEDGVNGFLINPADSEALADKIMTLIHNSSLSKKIVENAIDIIEKEYNVHEWCRKIETQYDSLLNNGKAQGSG
jgi:glycosyltransferase involved in cell wall biosynthesis